MKINRRDALSGLLVLAGSSAIPVSAQTRTRIVFGYTAVTDFASAFVAAQQGFFAQRGLDVELKFIPVNSTIPAAIESDALQIGGPTPSVFLQAVDGGLDQIVVAGGGSTAKSLTTFGLVVPAGSSIRSAKDCIGKKIGVPGLGAFLHVSFREWLKLNGVDYHKVTFIEAAFPQHGDLLRGGSLDGVVTADPFMSRIVDNGIGRVASYYTTQLPDGMPTIVYTAKRQWVEKNQAATRAFRDAIVEAARFIRIPKNNGSVRSAIGQYIKMPSQVLSTIQISPPEPLITLKQLEYWANMMKDQDMLKSKLALAHLLAT